jgi:enamine deaminase RidA (YjgF/YER057c/UK114 family)
MSDTDTDADADSGGDKAAQNPKAGSTVRHYSGAPWESVVGYCRAIRVGEQVFVTGTAPVTANGDVDCPGDPYGQAARCFEIIREALQAVGADLQHVVRTRMFVTDISLWEHFGQAHGEAFRDYPPATTMVEVTGLIDPAMLIEIEADAVVR